MPCRIILIASAALVAASPALGQQSADPAPRPPPVATEPAADEPPRGPREEVYVTGSRSLPVQRVDGARTLEQRQRDQAEGRCVLRAQESADPNEPDFGVPEAVCRDP